MTTRYWDGADDPVDVLVVEDDPDRVRLAEETFREEGVDAHVHVETDRDGALEYLEQRGDHADAPRPGLVLLDLDLPGASGDAVLRKIVSDPELASTPVVVLSSSDAEDDVRRAYELRANAYLTKPVDADAFVETIRSLRTFWLDTVRLPPTGSAG